MNAGRAVGLVGHGSVLLRRLRRGGFADGFGQVDDLRLRLKPKSGQRKFRLIAQRFVQHQNVVGEAAFFVRQRRTEHERFIRLVGLGRQGQRGIVSGSKRQGGVVPLFGGNLLFRFQRQRSFLGSRQRSRHGQWLDDGRGFAYPFIKVEIGHGI